MGNGNSTYGGGQDSAQLLRRFREVDGAYQSAPDAEKEKYFPRRHAALMMLLGTPPRTRDEIAEVMSVALDELAKDLMVPGPCRRPWRPPWRTAFGRSRMSLLSLQRDVASSWQPLISMPRQTSLSTSIWKSRSWTSSRVCSPTSPTILMASSSSPMFFALMNSAEAIRDALSSAVDKLMPTTMTTRRQGKDTAIELIFSADLRTTELARLRWQRGFARPRRRMPTLGTHGYQGNTNHQL